jgi:hypothetical protein
MAPGILVFLKPGRNATIAHFQSSNIAGGQVISEIRVRSLVFTILAYDAPEFTRGAGGDARWESRRPDSV